MDKEKPQKPEVKYQEQTLAQRRAYEREAKRASRKRKAQRELSAAEAEGESLKQADRVRRALSKYGQIAPNVEAATFEQELAVHREYLRALQQPDVQTGENLKAVARRVFVALLKHPLASIDKNGYVTGEPSAYVPSFSRRLQRFDFDYGHELPIDFETAGWTSPQGDDGQPINVEALPPLPLTRTPEPQKPEPTTEQSDAEAERLAIKQLSERTTRQREEERLRLLEMNGLPEAVRRYLQEGT